MIVDAGSPPKSFWLCMPSAAHPGDAVEHARLAHGVKSSQASADQMLYPAVLAPRTLPSYAVRYEVAVAALLANGQPGASLRRSCYLVA